LSEYQLNFGRFLPPPKFCWDRPSKSCT